MIREENGGGSAVDAQVFSSPAFQGGINLEDMRPNPHISGASYAAYFDTTAGHSGLLSDPTDLLSLKLGRVCLAKPPADLAQSELDCQEGSSAVSSVSCSDDFTDMELLLPDLSGDKDHRILHINDEVVRIQHAPLIDARIVSGDGRGLFPQYGLFGLYVGASNAQSKLLLNINVPFSMFICGVQGSGKSYTTSCILENAVIPSRFLGKLQSPLSALVLSYAQFSGDGTGFTVSEAAFLAMPDPRMPEQVHVKKVHVLVSPSNFVRISKLYLRLPNVRVTPFKIKSQDLDIDTILTLMNVGGSDETPLYMAQVTQILREMSTAGAPFDFQAFKMHIKKKKFNSAQATMLKMRLDLLESFLDVNGSCVEPCFQPGEITIMDMSCPFVDANKACILFRIGLKLYLQSSSSGKMIVLDEAHKYMLKVPGARALNENLLQTVRLQRHYGARVVVSTQEPTIMTDLIALCSVTVIHRFSSHEWLTAIRRHVPLAGEDREELISRIERLTTRKAILYSPNAILRRDSKGSLVTGSSKLFNVSIRRRLTSNGGHSILAV